MNKSSLIIATGVVFLVVLFLIFFEQVETRQRVPQSHNVRTNPYYAAELMFNELSLQANSSRYLATLPSTEDTIILFSPKDIEETISRRELLNWVREGGHLLFAFEEGNSLYGRTLSPEEGNSLYGRTLSSTEFRLLYSEDWFVITPDSREFSINPGRASIFLEEENEICWEISSSNNIFSPRERNCWAKTRDLGEGKITVFSTSFLFTNHFIGRAENAELLWSLVSIDTSRKVVIVFEGKRATLKVLILRHARLAVISLIALIAMTIWHTSAQFGPLARTPEPIRRSLMEHIKASAAMHWRLKQQNILLETVRSDVLIVLKKKLPQLQNMDLEEAVKIIVQESHFVSSDVSFALLEPASTDPQKFIRLMQNLQSLRQWST